MYHKECIDKLTKELTEADLVIDAYKNDKMRWIDAKEQIVVATSGEYTQKFFWRNIVTKSDIKTTDHLLFSQNLIEVCEEKNRCTMVRTGLSYAKYPQWETGRMIICMSATVAATDSGIYFLGSNAYYIPYSKMVDVGKTNGEVYIDVKTSSPHRHRYSLHSIEKDDRDFVNNVYSLVRMMANIERKG